MSSKIIVVGGVNGKVREVFKKIATLHAKNSFTLAIIVGDLFGDSPENRADAEALASGQIKIPLSTYFTLGRRPLPSYILEKLKSNNDELCENLQFIGKRATLKTSEGVRIVALGGTIDAGPSQESSKDKYSPFYNFNDAKSLKGAKNADILITSEWPQGIRNDSKVEVLDGAEVPVSQQCIAELCSALKPKYFFSVSDDFFYEREPFFHSNSSTESQKSDGYAITRFLSLASFGNTAKQKWIYAFSIDTSASLPLTLPVGTTRSPFSQTLKKRPAPANEWSRFSSTGQENHRPNKRARQPPPGPGECFFCLSNPNLATHLVTSIGNDAYLTTAKGPLTSSDTYPSLSHPAPYNILIIPLAHTPSLSSISEPNTRADTMKEMLRYRDALHKMISETSNNALGSVTWEVSRSTGVHAHWQFLPIPVDLISRGLVEAAFKVEAENEKYTTFENVDGEDIDDIEAFGDYFKVWIRQPSNGHESSRQTCMKLQLDPSFRFDLQFGRRVLGKLLGLESRINWRDCGQSVEEETEDAENFKAAFKPYDFSLE